VGPGRFSDPSKTVFSVPGVAPQAEAVFTVEAWAGDYDSFGAAVSVQAGSGQVLRFFSPTGSAESPAPGLVWMPGFTVYGVADPVRLLSLGLGWSNGWPQLSISGRIGSSYGLDHRNSITATDQWQSLMNQTNWVLTNNPQMFIDTSATGISQRFYRVGPPPMAPPPRLVWINPGTFVMGSLTNDPDRLSNFEGPQTQVTLTHGFWIGQYEVTQIEYQSILGTNPSDFIGDVRRPVETVTWDEATNYCAQLTERERAAGRLPQGYEYRLPTEAEWEYVARAGTTNRFSFGDDPGYTNLAQYAWYAANSGDQTQIVGQKQPNAWGVYDLYGNVWEWCSDLFNRYPGGSVVDPQGPSLGLFGTFRIIRGGSYRTGGAHCRSANRAYDVGGERVNPIGFRVVLAPVQQ
jgi:formylglycine-generating enzyme required for sulfatase activity